MSKKHRLNIKIIALLITSIVVTACSFSFPIDGVVVDVETNEPVEGVIILARWMEATGGHVGTMRCYLVESTVTDKKGRYHIMGWIKKYRNLATKDTYISAFKKGYEEHIIYHTKVDNSKLYVKKFKGTKSERFEYLRKRFRGNDCVGRVESTKNMAVHTKALFDEADELRPETSSQKQLIRALYDNYEHNLYGSIIGDERARKRFDEMKRKGYY